MGCHGSAWAYVMAADNHVSRGSSLIGAARQNPNAEVVVLPGCTRIGKLVPVAAISVAMEDPGPPTDGPAALPEYLEEIVGALTRRWVTQADNYFGTCYFAIVMFFRRRGSQLPAGPWQFNMISLRRTPGQFAAARLAPAGLRKGQTCVQEMLQGGQIEPSDSPWDSPVVLVTKKDGSTRFLWIIVD